MHDIYYIKRNIRVYEIQIPCRITIMLLDKMNRRMFLFHQHFKMYL